MRRILFYYHHFGGLGHGTRVYSLCKAIKKTSLAYQILVINSGVPQPELELDQYAKVINLPYFKAKNKLFAGLCSSENIENTFIKRDRILRLVAEKFKPDIAIFEHFPLGRNSLESEIIDFIKILKQDNSLIYSSTRDIILQKIPLPALKKRLELFNGIFVHSDKKMGLVTNFNNPDYLKNKIIFTGRVFPFDKREMLDKNVFKNKIKAGHKKIILVSIGGGIDGYDIIEKMLKIKNKIEEHTGLIYLISTGTSIPKDFFDKLINYAQKEKNIVLRKFFPNFPNYVNASDLYISMGGYNSINNALFTGVETIIFPRKHDKEQKIRAQYFTDFLNIGDIDCAPGKLAFKITDILSGSKKKSKYKKKLNGAEITARLLEGVLNLNYLKVRLTTKCNLSCDMCSVRRQKYELSFSRIKRLITHAKFLNVKTINFTGGEPTLHKNFYEILEFAKSHGFCTSVSTNGIMTEKQAACLLNFADYIDISIHSHTQEIDDRIKGKNGAFKNALGFIKYISDANKRINLQINVTIRPDNFKDIHKLIPILSKYVSSISLSLVDTSINNLEHLKFKKEQLRYFYFKEVPLILNECIDNDIRTKIKPFFADLQNLNNKAKLKKYIGNKEHYSSIFKSIFELDCSRLCPVARRDLRINSNGEICPCCYLDDYPVNLGNINKIDLPGIISSQAYVDFVTTARPNKGWCRKCAAGYKIYSEYS